MRAIPGTPCTTSLPTTSGPGGSFARTQESLFVPTGPEPSCPRLSSSWPPVNEFRLQPPTQGLSLWVSRGLRQGNPRGPLPTRPRTISMLQGSASQAEPGGFGAHLGSPFSLPGDLGVSTSARQGLRSPGTGPVPRLPQTCWQLSALGLLPPPCGVCVFQGPTAWLAEVLLRG